MTTEEKPRLIFDRSSQGFYVWNEIGRGWWGPTKWNIAMAVLKSESVREKPKKSEKRSPLMQMFYDARYVHFVDGVEHISSRKLGIHEIKGQKILVPNRDKKERGSSL